MNNHVSLFKLVFNHVFRKLPFSKPPRYGSNMPNIRPLIPNSNRPIKRTESQTLRGDQTLKFSLHRKNRSIIKNPFISITGHSRRIKLHPPRQRLRWNPFPPLENVEVNTVNLSRKIGPPNNLLVSSIHKSGTHAWFRIPDWNKTSRGKRHFLIIRIPEIRLTQLIFSNT